MAPATAPPAAPVNAARFDEPIDLFRLRFRFGLLGMFDSDIVFCCHLLSAVSIFLRDEKLSILERAVFPP